MISWPSALCLGLALVIFFGSLGVFGVLDSPDEEPEGNDWDEWT